MSECKNCSCSKAAQAQVKFIADFICPWSYIGLTRLVKVLENTGISPLWLPFELDPNTPVDGEERKEQRIKEFGSWEASLEKDAKAREASKEDGIIFHHELIKKTPNTSKSHRLMQLAEKEGKDTTQLALLIYAAYFSEGKDIGDSEVLIELGSKIGLDKDKLKAFFQGNEGISELRKLEEKVKQQKIDYIPYVIIGNHIFSGSKSAEEYSKAVESIP